MFGVDKAVKSNTISGDLPSEEWHTCSLVRWKTTFSTANAGLYSGLRGKMGNLNQTERQCGRLRNPGTK